VHLGALALALAVFALALAAEAQPAGKVWRIGYLAPGSVENHTSSLTAFEQGLGVVPLAVELG
jgi:hypothetical protein